MWRLISSKILIRRLPVGFSVNQVSALRSQRLNVLLSARRLAHALSKPARMRPWSVGLTLAGFGAALVTHSVSSLELQEEEKAKYEFLYSFGDEDAGSGVFRDPFSQKWTSFVFFNGKMQQLQEQNSKGQAQQDYDYVLRRVQKEGLGKKLHLDSSMNEEAQGRLIAMKTLDRMHENTKERTRDFKLNYLANILRAVQEDDASMLWRLSRGLLDLADEFFDEVDKQLELLAKAKECADLAKSAAPKLMLPNKWAILASHQLVGATANAAVRTSRNLERTEEERSKARSDLVNLRQQLKDLRKDVEIFRNLPPFE